ncbi:MAG: hypothetical protein JKY37_11680 [Nannocystaceae bacterium]|nr:hypothetical protein [Nannocystaceae bacterium]
MQCRAMWLVFVGLLGGGTIGAACQSNAFACQSDAACTGGRCEPQGWCSFPDSTCDSGHRFADHAVGGLAGSCVEDSVVGTSTATTADETEEVETTGTIPGPDGTTGPSTTAAGSSSDDGSPSGSSGEPPGPAITVTLPILSDTNDGSIYSGLLGGFEWAMSGEEGDGDGFFGEFPAGEHYAAYFRFVLPPQVSGASVVQARLRLEATSTLTYMWDSGSHAVGVWIEASSDAPPVESTSAFPRLFGGTDGSGVSLTGEMVRWPEAGGLTWEPEANTSPDLTPLFQALAEQAGPLVAGSHVQLWISVATPTGVGGEVTYVDFATGPDAQVAELELTLVSP